MIYEIDNRNHKCVGTSQTNCERQKLWRQFFYLIRFLFLFAGDEFYGCSVDMRGK